MYKLKLTFFLLLLLPFQGFAKKQPNIVLLLSDDQAWTDYGFMGHPHIKTPHMDKLVASSVLFERGYVPTALCSPSLATLATGQYAHKHGVTGNDPNPKKVKKGTQAYLDYRKKLANFNGFPTIGNLLAKKGYLTFQCGKWWNSSYSEGGFTHGMTIGDQSKRGRHGDVGLEIGRKDMKPLEDFLDICQKEDKPFYVWYAPFLPHTPHNPPERLLKNYLGKGLPMPVAKYYANCEWYDETVGQLIESLKKRKEFENTLFISLTDNGWIQDPDKPNRFKYRSKQTVYEGGIRTPIFYKLPHSSKGVKRPELTSSIDIFPTALAAAGITPDASLPGLNLLPKLKSGAPIERDYLVGEAFAHDIASYDNPKASLINRWCIKGNWKLIQFEDGELNRYAWLHKERETKPQLFDLSKDPAEKENLAEKHPEKVKELQKLLNDWYKTP